MDTDKPVFDVDAEISALHTRIDKLETEVDRTNGQMHRARMQHYIAVGRLREVNEMLKVLERLADGEHYCNETLQRWPVSVAPPSQRTTA